VYAGGVSVTGGAYDDRNVEETVLVPAPAVGVWTVRVAGTAIPLGPQPFALCITGGVGNGAGALAMDREEYGSASTIQLQVVDADAGPTVEVGVASATETTPEVVTLTGGDGVFTGTLTLSPLRSDAGDSVLSVADGDALTAVYADASPPATIVASARVSFDTPMITDVGAVSQAAGSALISWKTDRAASTRVRYGLTPALELGAVDSAGAGPEHRVLLGGLIPGATYCFDVESVSLTGSAARDSLGGAHHRVTIKRPGEVLLVYGESPFARSFAWEDALAAGGYDFDIWSGAQAASPSLGDRSSGLRSYGAVLWQAGFEQYPPLSDAQRAVLAQYVTGGGRLLVCGNDVAWALGSPSSPFYTPERANWLADVLKAVYVTDPAPWGLLVGYAGDPISGAYTAGIPYTFIWPGGGGDAVSLAPAAGGSGAYAWHASRAAPDSVALRWESGSPDGDPDSALWGGQPTRLVDMFFEFSALTPPAASPSALRNDVLDKTLQWLFGRPRPSVALVSPDGGEVVTGASVSVQWTESAGPGRTVADRALEYSLDGGSSWQLIADGVGPSPYEWDLSGVPNSGTARVRLRVTDDGAPALGAADASAADFALARSGADAVGPVVVPGSISVTPNPIELGSPAALAAQVSDAATGGGGVGSAEWSFGPQAQPAGEGIPMGGDFGTPSVDVSAALDGVPLAVGEDTLWVRGRDTAGNWGAAAPLVVLVNGSGTVAADAIPAHPFLSPCAPNPFTASTAIVFGLSRPGRADLAVFDVRGREVRRLTAGPLAAGGHRVVWDGRDGRGARAAPGVYYCRLVVPGARFEKRIVRM
jgi:hypothetical protein